MTQPSPPRDLKDWHTEETYKGLLSLGRSVLTIAATINGGAAVAFLAFIGRFFDGEIGTVINLFWAIRVPMLCFVAGLVCVGLGSSAAYVMQLKLYNEEIGRALKNAHIPWLYTAIGLIFGSYALFGIGAIIAAVKLT